MRGQFLLALFLWNEEQAVQSNQKACVTVLRIWLRLLGPALRLRRRRTNEALHLSYSFSCTRMPKDTATAYAKTKLLRWGLLKREIFIAIWLFICLAALLYLLGVYRFPHEAVKKATTRGRDILVMLSTFLLNIVISPSLNFWVPPFVSSLTTETLA